MAFYDGCQSMNSSLFVKHLFLCITVQEFKDTFKLTFYQCDARTALWFIQGKKHHLKATAVGEYTM